MIETTGGYDMNDDQAFIYMPRGLGKSRFIVLVEIDFLYQTGRITFDDYLNFTGEALMRLFNQSEEFVENWKEMARKQNEELR